MDGEDWRAAFCARPGLVPHNANGGKMRYRLRMGKDIRLAEFFLVCGISYFAARYIVIQFRLIERRKEGLLQKTGGSVVVAHP